MLILFIDVSCPEQIQVMNLKRYNKAVCNSGGQTGEWALVQEEQMGPLLTWENFH